MPGRLWLLFFLFFTFPGSAQENKPLLHLNFRIAPLSLTDFYNGSCYKGGVDIEPGGRWGLTMEAGGYFPRFNVWKDIRGFQIDGGIKYYLSRKQNSCLYLLLNVNYRENGFNYHDTIRSNPNYYTEYRTEKYVTCLNFSLGSRYYLCNSRFFLEYWAGLGIRCRNVSSTLTQEQLDKGIEYGDSQSLYFLVTPGRTVWPNITLGFRVGYRLY